MRLPIPGKLEVLQLGTLLLACACGTEVVTIPPASCDQGALDGPVDSDEALAIARCLVGEEVALLSLDGSGSGAASEGLLARWDVILLGSGVVYGVGIAEGLQAGTAEYPPEDIFGGGCADLLPDPATSSAVVPHALSAGLGPLGEATLGYRIESDCLAAGTTRRIVVEKGADRLLYSAEGMLVESCHACAADDPRDCCAL